MIQVWIGNIEALAQKEIYQACYRTLPPWRQKKADGYRRKEDRMRSVGAWVLYEQMRQHYQVAREAPFNLSHSGAYAMCAIEDSGAREVQVGCDIQENRRFSTRFAERYYAKEECAQLEGFVQADYEEACNRLWTLKESFVKAIREGMRLPFAEFAISLQKEAELIRQPKEYPGAYYFTEYEVEGLPYHIAVCSNTKDIERQLRVVTLGKGEE